MKDKLQLRQELIKRRKSLSDSDLQSKSRAICQRLLDEIDWTNVSSLHIYNSRDDWREVDTKYIIDCLSQLYPDLQIDIASQSYNQATASEHAYDVIVVPVLGYDSNNNRIGMGVGWYDRFLAEQPAAVKLGLAYKESHVDTLPLEQHDQPLNDVIAA